MEKKGISPKAPPKAKKDDKDGSASKQGELEVNPGNVMVALAQTDSKFFDLVSHEDESALPQT